MPNLIINIPTEEILIDRCEAIDDIRVCTTAMLNGVHFYSGGSVKERIDGNKRQIEVMDVELNCRGIQVKPIAQV